MNYIKNPIVIGIIACIISLLYIYYTRQYNSEIEDELKNKKINYITPLIIGVITWFLAESLLTKSDNIIKVPHNGNSIIKPIDMNIGKNMNSNIVDETICTDGTNTYNIVSKNNIKLPSMDVFIDLANFD
jgi:hypothetical protein